MGKGVAGDATRLPFNTRQVTKNTVIPTSDMIHLLLNFNIPATIIKVLGCSCYWKRRKKEQEGRRVRKTSQIQSWKNIPNSKTSFKLRLCATASVLTCSLLQSKNRFSLLCHLFFFNEWTWV
jgi:hypothetical protein